MKAKRLTIYVGEADHYGHDALYMAIVRRLRELGCAGATVTRGIAGFGAHSQIKTIRLLELSADLPIVITAVDAPGRIDRVIPEISAMLAGGTITVEDTEIVFTSAAFREGLPDVTVAQVMRTDVASVGTSTPAVDAMRQLVAATFSGLPVVDDAGAVVGFVTDTDLLGTELVALDASEQRTLSPNAGADLLGDLERSGKLVGDVMRRPAITVSPASSLREAARSMHEHGVKSLPVVDEAGKLVGVLGRLDVLQAIASGHATRGGTTIAALPQERARVADVMEQQAPSVVRTAPLHDVLDRLLDTTSRQIVVVDDERHPVGVISPGDLIQRVGTGDRPSVLTRLRSRFDEDAAREVRRLVGERAGDLMVTPVVTIRDDASVLDALKFMVGKHIKCVPVVDTTGSLVGVVSRAAVLAASVAPSHETGSSR
jgi:CBS-domain-containing membrane protein